MNDASGGRRAGITRAAAAAAGSGRRHAPRYTCCVAHCGCGAQCGRRRAAGGPTRGTGSATPRWATASSAPASCSPSATRPRTRCARQAPNSCTCGGGGAQATRACLRAAGPIARPSLAASALREPMDGTAPKRVCVCVLMCAQRRPMPPTKHIPSQYWAKYASLDDPRLNPKGN
jgi:hypothetical protein